MKAKPAQHHTTIGIDLGDKKHAVCVVDKRGEILREFSIVNEAKALQQLAADYPKARVGMETGTHSPWISRLLKSAGLEVIVANARKLRAIHTNERKCDAQDARTLARITRLDPQLLHPVSHRSERAQRDLLLIKLRDSLVRQRVAVINSVRASLKSLGVKLELKNSAASLRRAREQLAQSQAELLEFIEPALAALETLTTQIHAYDAKIAQRAQEHYPQALKLQAIGGVGPITSLCFVLSIEAPERFAEVRDIGAYLGLVPRRDQSGASDKQLPISKTGDPALRRLLVQSANYLLGPFATDCDLRRHGLKLAARGGKAAKKRATVAVARKLAVLMLTLWRKQEAYQPLHQATAATASADPKLTKPKAHARQAA